ncbi:hypothetical protein V8E53_010343 [Lactarius tabidus]
MADQDPSHQANPVSANTYPHPALHRLGGQVPRNPHGAGDYWEGAHWHREGAPQPVGNMVMQGEMHYPQHTGAPNYDAGHYHPAPLPYPQIHKFPMCTCIGMIESPNQSRPKYTLLLRRSKRITMAMVLMFPRSTLLKLSPESSPTCRHTTRSQRSQKSCWPFPEQSWYAHQHASD